MNIFVVTVLFLPLVVAPPGISHPHCPDAVSINGLFGRICRKVWKGECLDYCPWKGYSKLGFQCSKDCHCCKRCDTKACTWWGGGKCYRKQCPSNYHQMKAKCKKGCKCCRRNCTKISRGCWSYGRGYCYLKCPPGSYEINAKCREGYCKCCKRWAWRRKTG